MYIVDEMDIQLEVTKSGRESFVLIHLSPGGRKITTDRALSAARVKSKNLPDVGEPVAINYKFYNS